MLQKILSSSTTIFIELALVGLVAGSHAALAVTEFISEKDWGRLLGEDGFKAALLIGLVVVWCSSEKSKNQRHAELVEALSKRDAALTEREKKDAERIDQFIDLSTQHIQSQAKVVGAIEAFDSNSQRLYLKLEDMSDKLTQIHNQSHHH